MISSKTIVVPTEGFSDVHDLTGAVQSFVRSTGVLEGQAHVFAVGSTASITTLEHEPALVRDLAEALEALWPRTMRSHHSQTWGDDNGFSHLRAAFLGPQLAVPIHHGQLVLGQWQQIVLVDHDNRPRQRQVHVQVMGEGSSE